MRLSEDQLEATRDVTAKAVVRRDAGAWFRPSQSLLGQRDQPLAFCRSRHGRARAFQIRPCELLKWIVEVEPIETFPVHVFDATMNESCPRDAGSLGRATRDIDHFAPALDADEHGRCGQRADDAELTDTRASVQNSRCRASRKQEGDTKRHRHRSKMNG